MNLTNIKIYYDKLNFINDNFQKMINIKKNFQIIKNKIKISKNEYNDEDKNLMIIYNNHKYIIKSGYRKYDITINLKKKIVKNIHLVYFAYYSLSIDFEKEFKNILLYFKRTGILEYAYLYIILYDPHKLGQSLYDYAKQLTENVVFDFHYHNHWEYFAIYKCWEIAKSKPNDFLFYGHFKGLLHKDKDTSINKVYLNHTLAEWRYILSKFKDNTINKIGMFPCKDGYIWYNYWWIRNSYLITCPEPEKTLDRYYYEGYISTGTKSENSTFSLFADNFTYYTPEEAWNEMLKLMS